MKLKHTNIRHSSVSDLGLKKKKALICLEVKFFKFATCFPDAECLRNCRDPQLDRVNKLASLDVFGT